MIKELVKLANHLDAKGLKKEADFLDSVIEKAAQAMAEPKKVQYKVCPGESWSSIWEDATRGTGKSVEDNVALNEGMDLSTVLQPGDMLTVWARPEVEDTAQKRC